MKNGTIKRARLHFEQRTGEKNGRDDGGENDLKNKFDAAGHAVGLFLRDLQVIVHEAERAEINHAEQGRARRNDYPGRAQSKLERKTAPMMSTPPMVGVPLLGAVQFGQPMDFFRGANRLADFERGQFANDAIAENERDARRR